MRRATSVLSLLFACSSTSGFDADLSMAADAAEVDASDAPPDDASLDAASHDAASSVDGGSSAPVTGTGVCADVVIDAFFADPPRIRLGATSTLSIHATRARVCTLTPGDRAFGAEATTVVDPTTTTTFVLRCASTACIPGGPHQDEGPLAEVTVVVE